MTYYNIHPFMPFSKKYLMHSFMTQPKNNRMPFKIVGWHFNSIYLLTLLNLPRMIQHPYNPKPPLKKNSFEKLTYPFSKKRCFLKS